MELTGIDWAFLAGLAGTFLKSLLSDRKAAKAEDQARSIVADREQTKQERDREIEILKSEVKVLQHENKEVRERLSEGNGHFVRLEGEVKETNGLLREIIGALRNKGLVISETHKAARDAGLEL